MTFIHLHTTDRGTSKPVFVNVDNIAWFMKHYCSERTYIMTLECTDDPGIIVDEPLARVKELLNIEV